MYPRKVWPLELMVKLLHPLANVYKSLEQKTWRDVNNCWYYKSTFYLDTSCGQYNTNAGHCPTNYLQSILYKHSLYHMSGNEQFSCTAA